jgi:hypothetical protein
MKAKTRNRLVAYVAAVLGLATTLILTAPAAAVEDRDEEPQSRLVIAEENWQRLTPRQYLYLHYPEVAADIDRVAKCESGWKINAKSHISSASGLLQFIAGTWQRTRAAMGRDAALELRFDPYENIDTAVFLWNGGRGAHHWECARKAV